MDTLFTRRRKGYCSFTRERGIVCW
jgi:hypothetical protein